MTVRQITSTVAQNVTRYNYFFAAEQQWQRHEMTCGYQSPILKKIKNKNRRALPLTPGRQNTCAQPIRK